MPTTPIMSWSNSVLEPLENAKAAREDSIALAASTTYPAGTVLGQITATPGIYGAYASGHSDGTQTPLYLLKYPCVTDASGNITISATSGQAGGEWGETFKTAPAYRAGVFSTADLTGLDATALTNAGWKLISGTVASGVLMIPGA